MKLQAPFPWFGGKSRVAPEVWRRFGDVPNYVEPFFGSGAVLLGRPGRHLERRRTETVNDIDGFVANAWRALARDPDGTADHADWPVNENDLHARHAWLVGRRGDLRARLEGDPEYFDARIAGYWIWGISCWIGGHFASGKGPWSVVDGKLVSGGGTAGRGVNWKLPHLGTAGQGVSRKLPHLGRGRGVNRKHQNLHAYFAELSARLEDVRVCCGDWSRVVGPSVTHIHGLTGVFLDPPYGVEDRENCYTEESRTVALDVCDWCRENGENPLLRIALCGYEGEHDLPGWSVHEWKTGGGYASQSRRGNSNSTRERIWFSPACINPAEQNQMDLFEL